MNRRTASWLAWSLWATSSLLSGLALLFAALNPPELALPFIWGALMLALPFPAVGALIVSRHPQNAIGWIFSVVGLLQGLFIFTNQYGRFALLVRPGSLPGGAEMIWIGTWMWIPSIALLVTFLLLLFPNGRLPSPRWRPVAWLAMGGLVFTVVFAAVGFWPMRGLETLCQDREPEAAQETLERLCPPESEPAVDLAFQLMFAGFVVEEYPAFQIMMAGFAIIGLAALACVISLIFRFRHSQGVERQQLKWFTYAGSLAFAVLVIEFTPLQNRIIAGLGVLTIPIAVGIAILKYRLYDIDLIINRTLVYGSLTASVVGLYVLLVGGLGALFQSGGNLLISLLATAVVAVLFAPLRDRLQRGVNRLLYGQRDDPYAVLSRLGQRLEATLAPNAVLPTIVETVAQALKLPYVAIALTTADRRVRSLPVGPPTVEESTLQNPARGTPAEARRQRHASERAKSNIQNPEASFEVVAAFGVPIDDPLRLPLVYQGETVGRLLLAPRSPGEAFSGAERRLLDDLAREAGIAVHAVRLTTALQHSRERLVTAREEERRRLRRDLHDGLGPQLASLTLKLETARNRLAHDPIADALLADLTAQTQAAVADIRRLVYALRPPALDEFGLVSALRQGAAQYSYQEHPGVHITIDAPQELPPLPAAVEVAAYRITQEALTNVVRHAGPSTCLVRLRLDETAGWLCLEIQDDGQGLPAVRRSGVGLNSMRERAEELGGTWMIEPVPTGGTRVLARLPYRLP